MPIAKEVLRVGFTIAAVPGGYVTKDAVQQYGWQDKVEDGDDFGGTADEPAAAPRKSRKGSAEAS